MLLMFGMGTREYVLLSIVSGYLAILRLSLCLFPISYLLKCFFALSELLLDHALTSWTLGLSVISIFEKALFQTLQIPSVGMDARGRVRRVIWALGARTR